MPRSSRCADDRPAARRAIAGVSRDPAGLRCRSALDETGSASLEFLTAGLLLLVPLVYLVLTVASIQSAALATEGAARQAARAFVQAPSEASGEAAVARALALALDDHGVDAETEVRITCRPDPTECHTRRGWVTVQIAARVPLPLVPPVLDLEVPLSVPIDAIATQQVSRFWGER